MPCPGCGEPRNADEGHHLCRRCEGYEHDRNNRDDELHGEPGSPLATWWEDEGGEGY